MSARPIPLIIGAGLLIVIGVSGLGVAGSLLGVALSGGSGVPGVTTASLAIGTGLAVYTFATIMAGFGVLLLRRWAWRLGLISLVLGITALVGSMIAASSADPILLGGAAFWAAAFVCLVAPSTRNAIGA